MPVTDDQVAVLLALLAGDYERYQQLHANLDSDAARTGYSALIAAAFFKAANRRFTARSTHAEVIEFIGDVRARSDEAAGQLDPLAAEALVEAALGRGSDSELDDMTVVQVQLIVLGALIADEGLDQAGLNAALVDARALADSWLS